jgi:hypothetical protein
VAVTLVSFLLTVRSMLDRRSFALAALLPVFVGCSAAENIETDTSSVTTATCLQTLACEAPDSPPFKPRMWRNFVVSPGVTLLGDANHRGRDIMVNPGEPQTIIGKFAYGLIDKDLEDEEVDIYVQRDCSSGWEKLGTAITTAGGNAPANVEGVPAANGRVYFRIPQGKELGLGRHRIRMVVAGDGSKTDLFIDVIPPKTPVFVSDVDGTLTSSETVEFVKLLTDDLPNTHPAAAESLRILAAKGYRPIYVTARPEWLTQRTRDFLDKHGFPPGIIRTSTSLMGAGFGPSAATYKKDQMAAFAGRGLVPSFGFGNKTSDADAYVTIPNDNQRFFFKLAEEVEGRRIDSYTALPAEFQNLAKVCQ